MMNKSQQSDDEVYQSFIARAIDAIRNNQLNEGDTYLRQALAFDYSQPDAFNALGLLMEKQGKRLKAQNYYRVALSLDPTFIPARNNLDGSIGLREAASWSESTDTPWNN
jgi:Tfp pilus assembly protein PilF